MKYALLARKGMRWGARAVVAGAVSFLALIGFDIASRSKTLQVFTPDTASADIPYSQASYYSQSSYYAESSYSGDGGDADDGCSSDDGTH